MSDNACPYEPDFTEGLWGDLTDTPDEPWEDLSTHESMRLPVIANYGCCNARNHSLACGKRRKANSKPKTTK